MGVLRNSDGNTGLVGALIAPETAPVIAPIIEIGIFRYQNFYTATIFSGKAPFATPFSTITLEVGVVRNQYLLAGLTLFDVAVYAFPAFAIAWVSEIRVRGHHNLFAGICGFSEAWFAFPALAVGGFVQDGVFGKINFDTLTGISARAVFVGSVATQALPAATKAGLGEVGIVGDGDLCAAIVVFAKPSIAAPLIAVRLKVAIIRNADWNTALFILPVSV